MSEIWSLKVSWSTDMSPTPLFSLAADRWVTARMSMGVEGVYPGWWGMGWVGGVLYRYPAQPSQIPVFSHILALRPYLRPNKGNS